ncbi:Uncharacterized conserved protein [Plasmopara halstedii]|uniref:Uncharacterized conserved protein n=1 Tax=Plasmopara halstedii TaxID=4781 RepID=A0A0P1AFH2_PLAHL|nr:Uncharacterized conserved protein [Plasmopara halstedii]CEG39341.1 Uncharacterized conserved protein [Plasmopara halstedii]|eukprot:XP_024575710.1 Uncharacterized conserved protein [Plasmopara halstedii]
MNVGPFANATRIAPMVATSVVIITLLTCVSLAKAKDIYLGGLAWPYFSDTGRDAPAYTVFCAGLSIVAVALIVTWTVNYKFQAELIEMKCQGNAEKVCGKYTRKCCLVVLVLGVLSTFGLPVLAFFSTTSYPDVHKYAAYWFFVLEAIALVVNTYVSYKLARLTDRGKSYSTLESDDQPPSAKFSNLFEWSTSGTKRTFCIQLFFTTIFLIGFLLYIPVGLALIDDFQRLSIADCLNLDLGDRYCNDTMKLNDEETVLWNYGAPDCCH